MVQREQGAVPSLVPFFGVLRFVACISLSYPDVLRALLRDFDSLSPVARAKRFSSSGGARIFSACRPRDTESFRDEP